MPRPALELKPCSFPASTRQDPAETALLMRQAESLLPGERD